jgi:DNA-binding GntR family transcriptional regulator
MTEMPLVYRTYNWYSAEQRLRAQRQHEELVRALAAGDGERAELTMRDHILDGWEVLAQHIAELAAAGSASE